MKKNDFISAVGIIAEYNPFHNGHRYQIEKARQITKADYVIAVMSGDFVQRGTPAIYDKYTRTAMALQSGVDLVIELPAAFATSSAEDFAACGVSLLTGLGAVNSVCFGSECGDIAPMVQIATILANEPAAYTGFLKEELRLGTTYPQARTTALRRYLKKSHDQELEVLLNSPNNILGIEYCKALIRQNSPITPVTIPRAGSGYHDISLTTDFCSASALRMVLRDQDRHDQIRSQVPEAVFSILMDSAPLDSQDFSLLLNTAILRLMEEGDSLSRYCDVSEELETRIRKYALDFCSFEKRIEQLKTKQYTYTRVSRALLHLMLGIKKEDTAHFCQRSYAPYARVLGFRKSAATLLTQIKQRGTLPLITKTADASGILLPEDYRLLQQDFHCSHIYDSAWNARYQKPVKNEYNRPLIIL